MLVEKKMNSMKNEFFTNIKVFSLFFFLKTIANKKKIFKNKIYKKYFLMEANLNNQIEEFFKHIKCGGSFNVLGCKLNRNTDSFPNAYIHNNNFIQKQYSLSIGDKIDQTFLGEVQKVLLEKDFSDQWNFVITNEGIFNKNKDVIGFSPIDSMNLGWNYPGIF